MDEELIPFIALFLIFLGWVFYLNLGGKRQKFYKEGTKFKDDFGEYFEEDIKKLVKYVEDLPIFESYLRSESEKMSFNKGAEIRKYLFLKMKKLIPNDHNLKILLTINNIK